MPRYMTLEEAATKTKGRDGKPLSAVTLRVAVRRGSLAAHKNGKTWYVSESALSTYLKNRPRWWQPSAQAR